MEQLLETDSAQETGQKLVGVTSATQLLCRFAQRDGAVASSRAGCTSITETYSVLSFSIMSNTPSEGCETACDSEANRSSTSCALDGLNGTLSHANTDSSAG